MATEVQQLVFGVPLAGDITSGRSLYYRFEATNGQTLRVRFEAQSARSANEVLVGFGYIPTRTQFTWGAHRPFVTGLELLVPVEETGSYYVLVHCAHGLSPFTITAEVLPLLITRVSPTVAGNGGPVTFVVQGALFKPGMVFALTNGTGTALRARGGGKGFSDRVRHVQLSGRGAGPVRAGS